MIMTSKDAVTAKTKTILVVDDDQSIRDFFRMILERDGFKVIQMKDGVEAVLAVSDNYFKTDLIVIDLAMPGNGGYTVLKELQAGASKDIPIIIVTAKALDDGIVDMFRA